MIEDKFIEIKFSTNNLDIYLIRKSILNSIKKYIKLFKGNLLDVGCGKMPYREFLLNNSSITSYVGIDIETALQYDSKIKPDKYWDGNTIPFADNHFSTVIATEVLEHCPDPQLILKEINRVLEPKGIFFFTVPFLWPLHEVPNDEYRYTPYSLVKLLKFAGFTNIEVYPSGGWHASMAQMLSLWLIRSHMNKVTRNFLVFLLKPMILLLIKMDRHSDNSFKESQMITGLYGIAQK